MKIKLHDFSMTIYAVFRDARKANTEDHLCIFITYKKERKISFQAESNESKIGFASCVSLRFGI